MIAIKICLRDKIVTYDELIFFLTGAKAGYSSFKEARYEWLEDKQYKAIQMLDSIVPSLKLINDGFAMNEKEWKKWLNEAEPQMVSMPGEADNYSEWIKCLIIKALRPEKLVFSMKFFIKDKIGESFA